MTSGSIERTIAMKYRYLVRHILPRTVLPAFLACDRDQTNPKDLPRVKTFPVTITKATWIAVVSPSSDGSGTTAYYYVYDYDYEGSIALRQNQDQTILHLERIILFVIFHFFNNL